MRKYAIFVIVIIIVLFLGLTVALASPPREQTVKAKFYDFSEQLIDGQVRRPTALYTDSRQEAKFKRLLRIKRSFMKELFNTSRDPVFK